MGGSIAASLLRIVRGLPKRGNKKSLAVARDFIADVEEVVERFLFDGDETVAHG